MEYRNSQYQSMTILETLSITGPLVELFSRFNNYFLRIDEVEELTFALCVVAAPETVFLVTFPSSTVLTL